MKVLQIILIALTALSGCAKKTDATITNIKHDTTTTMPDTGSYTYLALGDSYTVGESVPVDQSFPAQLTSLLTFHSFYVAPPTIIAITGWTTNNLIHAIADNEITQQNIKFDFVTLLIGVNDQFQGLSQDSYRTNFVQLLHTSISFAKGDSTRVFVLSIPDYGATPFGHGNATVIGQEIDQFNAINKEESTKAGVHYLDITGISREAATDPTLIAPDNLHPSAKMYKEWITQLEPMVVARLKKH